MELGSDSAASPPGVGCFGPTATSSRGRMSRPARNSQAYPLISGTSFTAPVSVLVTFWVPATMPYSR